MINELECLFICFLAIWRSALVKCLVKSVVRVSVWWLASFLLMCGFYLLCLWALHMRRYCCSWLHTLVMPFDEQKFIFLYGKCFLGSISQVFVYSSILSFEVSHASKAFSLQILCPLPFVLPDWYFSSFQFPSVVIHIMKI